MAFPQNITYTDRTYSVTLTDKSKSEYRNADAVSPEENELQISHFISKTGKVNSAVIMTDRVPVPGAFNRDGKPVFEEVTAVAKVVYSENSGMDTDTIAKSLISRLIETLSKESDLKKILNREH